MAGIQIQIEVVDKFSKQLIDLDKSMSKLADAAKKQNAAFNILAADVVVKYGREAATAMVDFGRDCVKSFAESEEGSARLKIAMTNLGVFTEDALQRQLRFSEAIQKTTAFSDEQATGVQTQLTSFGLYGKELERVTKLTLDLAAGQKMDASQAAMLLGKAFVGQTGTLSKLGITFEESGTRAQKFESILSGVQRRFGGSAAAELDTYNGQVKALANAFDQIKEKIGADLIGSVKGAHGPLLQLVEDIDKNYEAIKRYAKFAATVSMLPGGTGALVAVKNFFNQVASAEEDALARGTAAFKKDKEERYAAQAKPPAAVDNEAIAAAKKLQDEQRTLDESALQKLRSYTKTSAELKMMQEQDDIAFIATRMGHDAAVEAQAAQSAAREKAIKITAAQGAMMALGQLATLQHAKNKELAAIGKAAAIGQAVIQTYLGATMAATSMVGIPLVGPFLAAAASAAFITAGLANVAMITGTPLAKGGLVRSRSGGTQAIIGEGGRDEAVIPLDDPSTQRRLAGAFGGGKGVNVTIGGGIHVTVQGESLDGNTKSLAAKLAGEVRDETVDAITLSLLIKNLSSLNAGMAA